MLSFLFSSVFFYFTFYLLFYQAVAATGYWRIDRLRVSLVVSRTRYPGIERAVAAIAHSVAYFWGWLWRRISSYCIGCFVSFIDTGHNRAGAIVSTTEYWCHNEPRRLSNRCSRWLIGKETSKHDRGCGWRRRAARRRIPILSCKGGAHRA